MEEPPTLPDPSNNFLFVLVVLSFQFCFSHKIFPVRVVLYYISFQPETLFYITGTVSSECSYDYVSSKFLLYAYGKI